MSIETAITIDAPTRLSDINTIVRQNESFIGPLVRMGNNGKSSEFFFENDPQSPSSSVVITLAQDRPSSNATVCEGTIFVEGRLVSAVATRSE
jgi:hypothetical protein